MWIAYKIYYLCDRKQRNDNIALSAIGCELLTKFIIFAIGNNWRKILAETELVVNCLQNLLSLRSETTYSDVSITTTTLWIAYKIYYLCDRKQPTTAVSILTLCCELLTKFIIFAIGNNIDALNNEIAQVVNCLQNLLSLRSETTPDEAPLKLSKLWIAYKIYYLCDRKQLHIISERTTLVVNCLQNLLSLRSETTITENMHNYMLLWIAYKIYYLCDRKQLSWAVIGWPHCCELLTKFIIFAIGNNYSERHARCNGVVNCLQNLLSLRSETTVPTPACYAFGLWIAYKIYYLCDRKQLIFAVGDHFSSCELLTKFIIFAIGNNERKYAYFPCAVVNCLQNLLSLRSETTSKY